MKKFLCFFAATIILFGMVGFLGFKYLVPTDYPVFLESFSHGVMTIESDSAFGDDNKFEVFCKAGEKLTVNINPERTESAYYDLDRLTVNGVDVTSDVKMLEYSFVVTGKTTVLAYFKRGKAPSVSGGISSVGKLSAPDVLNYADNEYFGSANAYDIYDPSVIYDDNSGFYYCFASNNVVMRSKDLINWEHRDNYFKVPESAESDKIMSFSSFASVEKWAKVHGYEDDESLSNISNDRTPYSPDVIKVGDTYYLYFSLTKELNSNESAVFCVKTKNLSDAISSKSWEDAGMVVCSCGHNSTAEKDYEYDAANAAMPSVFLDKDGEKMYMAYGSYFGRETINGSIRLLELDKETGLLKDGSSINKTGDKIGTMHGDNDFGSGVIIANPGKIPTISKENGSLISSCDVSYNKEEDYYYLYMTYGVSETNYEIRVARSKNADGPYLDMNDNDVAAFGKTMSNNQYTKGTVLMSGYNFFMSSNGGVSYTDVGRASIGSPFVFYTGGKTMIASQSRGYYKVDGSIYCGETIADENDYSVDALPALEIRQIMWSKGWPVALPETYANETVGEEIKKGALYGHWDAVIFDGSAPEGSFDAVSRKVSTKGSLFDGVVITEKRMKKGSELSDGQFKKVSLTEYTVVIDGVTYTVHPVIVWDNELDRDTIALVGFGDNGNTIWMKKGFNTYMGIYLDAYNYLLDIAPEKLGLSYKKKLDKISEDPSQDTIDTYTKELIKKILKSYNEK